MRQPPCMPASFGELEYLYHNPQIILELVEWFSIKLTICVSNLPGKAGKGIKIVGTYFYKLILFTHTGMRIRWNLATVSSRLRDSFFQLFKKEDKEENKNEN